MNAHLSEALIDAPISKADAIAQRDVKALVKALRAELVPNLPNIPDDLKQLKAWLCWETTQINEATGKFNKIPRYPVSGNRRSGTQGGPSDLAGLGTWEQARSAFESNKSWAGIGFATLEAFDVVGVDIDHCVKKDGQVRADADAITNEMYCEISPSGTGVRGFVRGSATDSKNHDSGYELFHSKGFVTVSGAQVQNVHYLVSDGSLPLLKPEVREKLESLAKARGKSTPIVKSTGALAVVSDRPDPMFDAIEAAGLYERDLGNGKHSILCPFEDQHSDFGRAPGDGDTVYMPPGHNGHIEGHIHCSHTHSNSQTAYWNAIGYDVLLGEFDVLKEEERRRMRLMSAADLVALPPLQWRIKGVLPERGVAAVYGPSGSGKSFLVLDMLAAISVGSENWHGYRCKAVPVVYVCLEGEAGLVNRVNAYRRHYAYDCAAMHFVTAPFALFNANDVRELAQIILDAGGAGAVVCIDTLNQATPGADENASADMGRAIAASKALQAAIGGLTLLVHHTGKTVGQGPRGHSSLFAALDAAVEVERNGDARAWIASKSKDGADGKRHSFSLQVIQLGVDDDLEPITSCVVVAEGIQQRRPKALSPSQQSAFDALLSVCMSKGIACNGGRGIQLADWRTEAYQRSTADTVDAKSKAFQRARSDLVAAGVVAVANDVYWPTDERIQDGFGDFYEERTPDIHRTLSGHVRSTPAGQTGHVS